MGTFQRTKIANFTANVSDVLRICLRTIHLFGLLCRVVQNFAPFPIAKFERVFYKGLGVVATDDEQILINILDQDQMFAVGGVNLVHCPFREIEIVSVIPPKTVTADQRPEPCELVFTENTYLFYIFDMDPGHVDDTMHLDD